jgi:hypothetical protein
MIAVSGAMMMTLLSQTLMIAVSGVLMMTLLSQTLMIAVSGVLTMTLLSQTLMIAVSDVLMMALLEPKPDRQYRSTYRFVGNDWPCSIHPRCIGQVEREDQGRGHNRLRCCNSIHSVNW